MSNPLGWCVGVLILGCGARSEIPFDDPTGDSFEAPPTQPPAAPESEATSGRNRGDFFESVALPDCMPGSAPSPGRTCPYMSDQLCYPDKTSACACACPRSHDSVCTSGLFGNEFGALSVRCH